MSGIIWLASYPKSGNTWLRAFLANHFQNKSRAIPINELPNYAIGDNFLVHYERLLKKSESDISDEEATEARAKVHHWFASAQGHTAFVKTHNIVGKVDDHPLITPEATAGAIYIMRHPFDVAISWSHHYKTSLDKAVDALCRTGNALPRGNGLLTHLGSWAEHVHSWTTAPGLTRHVLRYEDLQNQPRRSFAALVGFLGLPPDQARLKRSIRFSSFRELANQERKKGFVEARPDGATRFFRDGRVGSGTEGLTPEQQQRLSDALGDVMSRYGYGADGTVEEWQHAC